MVGVEILDTTYEYAGLLSPWWCAGFLIAGLIVCILGVCTIMHDNIQKILKPMALIIVACAIICFFGSMIKTDEVTDVKYDVTISDEVNFKEFQEKYEIIEQKGKIFTIKEKSKEK